MAKHHKTGWIANAVETESFAASLPALYGEQLDGLPYDLDRSAFPYRHLSRALKGSRYVTAGRLVALNQGSVGSCVGFMGSRCADLVAAADVYQRRQPEVFPNVGGRVTITSPEYCYGASREIVGSLGRWDGSTGSSMARALREWGVAFQQNYNGSDLTRYSGKRAREWARRGVPSPVVTAARDHPFRATVRVKTLEHAVGLIQNGYPVGICSGLAWSSRRDADGFARRVRPGWAHAMAAGLGFVVYGRKRGVIVQNSWGDWNDGPTGEQTPDLPVGAFVCYVDDFADVLRSGDCWSYGGFKGFEIAPFDWERGLGW